MKQLKLFSNLLLLLVAADASLLPTRNIVVPPFLIGADGRKLEDTICSHLEGFYDDLYQQLFRVGSSCSCTDLWNWNLLHCSSIGKVECQGICGTVHTDAVHLKTFLSNGDITLNQVEEQSCIKYTKGRIGERCSYHDHFEYCDDGAQSCNCEADINGVKCNSCEVCQAGDFAYTPDRYDCSNIQGIEFNQSDCEDSSIDFFGLESCYLKGGGGSCGATVPSCATVASLLHAVMFFLTASFALVTLVW
jgi:hypothetical protein